MDKLEDNKMELAHSFGSQNQKVEQVDKTPKKVFGLRVYASAAQCPSEDFKPQNFKVIL